MALGLFALAGLTAVSCASQPPPELTASDVLQKASDALKKVKAAHFKLSATGGMMAIGTGLVAKTIEGDVIQPDRLRGTAVSTFGKVTVEIGFIFVGANQFITNPITKQWEKLPDAGTAPNLLDPDRGASILLKQATNLQKLSNEHVAGVDCYHVTGDVPSTLVASLVGASGTTSALAGDVWVGVADFLPRQIRLNGAVTADEPPQIQRLLELSAFDESVTIDPPV
jgi:hypothetical protein